MAGLMRTWALLCGSVVLALATGCTDWDDDDDHPRAPVVQPDPACGGSLRRGFVDTDQTLEADAAEGVGIFVEYLAGGHWHVFTTCDTDLSGAACLFDIVLTTASTEPVIGVGPDGLESSDVVELSGDHNVRALLDTDYDFDGLYLQTEPGSVLSIDALLDDACGNAYVYWIGDGAIHSGAPSTPFELEPSAP